MYSVGGGAYSLTVVLPFPGDYDYAVSTCWYYVPHTNEFLEYLRSELGSVWTGDISAADALSHAEAHLIEIFEGY